jgi:hypothetical protein
MNARPCRRRAAAWSGAAALLLAGLAAGGCAGEGDREDALPETTTAVEAPTTTAAPVRPADGLRAFGAGSETWFATHEPATGPNLPQGCCFKPLLPDGRPSVFGAFWVGDRIVSYSLRFAEPLTLDAGRETVARHAPEGAELVSDELKDTCRIIQYAHPALEKAFGKGQAMGAALYSRDGKPFDGRVRKIIFAALPKGDSSFGC